MDKEKGKMMMMMMILKSVGAPFTGFWIPFRARSCAGLELPGEGFVPSVPPLQLHSSLIRRGLAQSAKNSIQVGIMWIKKKER